MAITVRQLVEKSIENTMQLYIIFVDLRKGYDLVPHKALWIILKNYV